MEISTEVYRVYSWYFIETGASSFSHKNMRQGGVMVECKCGCSPPSYVVLKPIKE